MDEDYQANSAVYIVTVVIDDVFIEQYCVRDRCPWDILFYYKALAHHKST